MQQGSSDKTPKKKKRSLDKHNWISKTNNAIDALHIRVIVQGAKSLGGHFSCLCRGFDFYEIKKNIIFQKEKGNTLNHFYSEKSSKRAK